MYLPTIEPPVREGKVAFTTRDELGESIATLLAKGLSSFPTIKPRTEKNIILLTSQHTESLVELVDAINKGRNTKMQIKYLEPEAWIEGCAKDDEGGKPRGWFEARLVFLQGIVNGDAATADPALQTLLGRTPEAGTQAVERQVKAEPGYTWHQNHMR